MSTEADKDGPIPTEPNALRKFVARRNQRHARFAFHMAHCEDQGKSARLAGYSDDRASCRTQGHRLMQDPAIIALVAVERAERSKRLLVTEERITAALSAIAFGDVREVVRWDDDGVSLVSRSDDLSDDEASIVQGVIRKERIDKEGNRTVTTEVKLADRKGAVESLARIKGMFKDKLDVTGLDGFAARLARSNMRKAERKSAAASPPSQEAPDAA